jgi:membrane protein DedA with SNARE-associated domain
MTERLLGPATFAAFVTWVERHGIVAIILCRAVPVFAEASIVALGAARGRTLPLLAAATLADICLGAAFAFAGAAHGPTAAPSAPAYAAAMGIPLTASLVAFLWMRRG